MYALNPRLNGRELTVDYALRSPTHIRDRIARLADDQILLPKFFHNLGGEVTGGGMLYSQVKASDFFTTDVEQRTPGTEYRVVEGVDPEPKLALVEDWGGKFKVTDEQISRNDISYIDQQTTQLANTIARKIDEGAMKALEAAMVNGENTVPGHPWAGLVLDGPADSYDPGDGPVYLTPPHARPTADLAAAQLVADLQELGVKHDMLVVHPEQAADLRVAYAENLDAMLKSAGVSLFSNPRIAAGTAWAIQSGQVGTVGFERSLTVDTWDDRSVRAKWVQAYVVPAFAVDRPYAAKKITNLGN